MAKSIKPTVIMVAVISLPFWLVGGLFLYEQDMLTLKNALLVLLATPFMVIVLLASTKGPYIVWNRKDLEDRLPDDEHRPEK